MYKVLERLWSSPEKGDCVQPAAQQKRLENSSPLHQTPAQRAFENRLIWPGAPGLAVYLEHCPGSWTEGLG